MNRMSDEEIQKLIEQGNTSLNTSDAKAYEKIFAVLSKEPLFDSSLGLMDKIMLRVEAKRKRAERLDMVYLFTGIFSIIMLAAAALVYLDIKLDINLNLSFLNIFSDYTGLIIIGGLMIALIQFLDKKFVRGRFVN